MTTSDTEVLLTERLVIRRFRPEDWKDLQAYVSLKEVTRYEPDYPTDDVGCRSLAEFLANNPEFWAVTLRHEDKVIGHIHCGPRLSKEAGNWNLGFVFHPGYQGKGFATEAAGRVMQYGFEVLNVRRFASGCNPLNTPSWKLLERLGMRREAHHIKDGFLKRDSEGNPLFQDSYIYAILKEEWLDR